MIFFIDFGLLRSPYCKISYLFVDLNIRVKISQPTYDSVCEDIIVGFVASVGNVFIKRLQTFTNVFFLIFIRTFITSVIFMPLCADLSLYMGKYPSREMSHAVRRPKARNTWNKMAQQHSELG